MLATALALVASGLAAGAAALWTLGETLPALGAATLSALSLGAAAASRTPSRPRARRAARPRRGAQVALVPVQTRAGPIAAVPMEHGRASAAMADARLRDLRLTGDILRGMGTGGKTTRGRCSRCDATLWLSARRPLKATCPSCGHTRVLN